ncbi:MAG: hypothetical protein IKP67_03395 [Spirochaetales bacterium]|nr:hypothetical protein [Spirochaetales bacterium]
MLQTKQKELEKFVNRRYLKKQDRAARTKAVSKDIANRTEKLISESASDFEPDIYNRVGSLGGLFLKLFLIGIAFVLICWGIMMPFYIKSKKTDQAKYQQEVEKYKKINEDIEVMNSVNEQHAADDLVKQIINSQVDSSALDRFGGTGDGAYKLTQIYEKDIPESIKSTITKDYFIVYKWWHDYI